MFVLCGLNMDVDAWWMWGKKGNNGQCPRRRGAFPYYFGTTKLRCLMKLGKKGKRAAPSRGIWEFKHRWIYYRGKYYEFGSNSYGYYHYRRLGYRQCSAKRERSPAGYSKLSLQCIDGCAKNYRCRYGRYTWYRNNCHKFANRISAILCTRSRVCPRWCSGSCNFG